MLELTYSRVPRDTWNEHCDCVYDTEFLGPSTVREAGTVSGYQSWKLGRPEAGRVCNSAQSWPSDFVV